LLVSVLEKLSFKIVYTFCPALDDLCVLFFPLTDHRVYIGLVIRLLVYANLFSYKNQAGAMPIHIRWEERLNKMLLGGIPKTQTGNMRIF
jgi:hypothetical protein